MKSEIILDCAKVSANSESLEKPDLIKVTLTSQQLKSALTVQQELNRSGFNSATKWWAVRYDFFAMHEEDGLMPFEPDYTLDGGYLKIYAMGAVKVVFPCKHSEEKLWVDLPSLEELQKLFEVSQEPKPLKVRLMELVITCPSDQLESRLQELVDELNPHRISLHWHVVDVMGECDWLTEEQALEVLQRVKDNHDCNHGVCWDTISDIAESMYPDPNPEPEEEIG